MKPRQETAPLTLLDSIIWHKVCGRWPTRLPIFAQPWKFSEFADRRDADLMLGIAQGRNLRIDHPGDPSGDFSGWLFVDEALGRWFHPERLN